jgi:hypothetical protein
MLRVIPFLIPAGLAAALIGCSTPAANQPASDPTPGPTKPQEQGKPPRPNNQCLLDEFGIHRKVLITERGVRCRASQPGGEFVGNPLNFYWIYFVFDAVGSGESAWYQVGETPSRDSIRGWVRGSVAAPWNTRLSAAPLPDAPLRFYAKADHLETQVKTGRTDAEPVAIWNPTAGRKLMPWPIAESKLVEHGGQTHELVRVLFLGEYRADTSGGPAPLTAGELEAVRDGVRRLDVVFVVDNTLSTTQYVPQIVTALGEIAGRISKSAVKPDVRFGLVLYRDHGIPELAFPEGGVVKVFPFTESLPAFTETTAPLKAATVSSGEWEEAVADGVKAGLTDFAWRDDKLAERVLILVGDSAGHAPESPKNPQGITDAALIKLATDRGVRLFTLAIKSGNPEEQKRQAAQYAALAAGARGECHTLTDPGSIADVVNGVFGGRAKQIEQRAEYIEQRAAGRSDADLIASGRLDERQRCEIVEFLRGAGIDPARLGPGGIGFGTGWCLAEHLGRPLIEKRVFAAHWEIDLLLANLNDLLPRLSAPKDFVAALEESVGAREGRFFHRPPAEAPNETMDVFLRKKGIPSRHGLLAYTRAEFLSMSEDRRAALRAQLRNTFIPELTRVTRDDQLFFRLSDVEFSFVPDRLFP